MDESVDSGAVESPVPEADLSIAEHAARFGPNADRTVETPPPPAETETPAETITDADPGDETRERDASGKFIKTPRERKAASQKATGADVPRIAELTRRLRETERERDEARNAGRTVEAPAAPTQAAPTPQPSASIKPKLEDFGYDVEAWGDALTDWKLSEKERTSREQTERQALATSWNTRIDAAKAKYPDFEDVALLAPTRIPPGSLVDAWILEHKTGADVLYFLQQHPAELDAMLKQPVIDQAEALSLLSQRLAAPLRSQAMPTGAVATAPVSSVPRPPTPVRTATVRVADGPPDGELSIAEHEKHYNKSAQRFR